MKISPSIFSHFPSLMFYLYSFFLSLSYAFASFFHMYTNIVFFYISLNVLCSLLYRLYRKIVSIVCLKYCLVFHWKMHLHFIASRKVEIDVWPEISVDHCYMSTHTVKKQSSGILIQLHLTSKHVFIIQEKNQVDFRRLDYNDLLCRHKVFRKAIFNQISERLYHAQYLSEIL